jgi:hypothetical protein
METELPAAPPRGAPAWLGRVHAAGGVSGALALASAITSIALGERSLCPADLAFVFAFLFAGPFLVARFGLPLAVTGRARIHVGGIAGAVFGPAVIKKPDAGLRVLGVLLSAIGFAIFVLGIGMATAVRC